MNNRLKQAVRKAEQAREEKRLERKKGHKCTSCAFGSWTGLKFYCPFGSCAKDNLRR